MLSLKRFFVGDGGHRGYTLMAISGFEYLLPLNSPRIGTEYLAHAWMPSNHKSHQPSCGFGPSPYVPMPKTHTSHFCEHYTFPNFSGWRNLCQQSINLSVFNDVL